MPILRGADEAVESEPNSPNTKQQTQAIRVLDSTDKMCMTCGSDDAGSQTVEDPCMVWRKSFGPTHGSSAQDADQRHAVDLSFPIFLHLPTFANKACGTMEPHGQEIAHETEPQIVLAISPSCLLKPSNSLRFHVVLSRQTADPSARIWLSGSLTATSTQKISLPVSFASSPST